MCSCGCARPCKCKLSIACLCLSAAGIFLQVICAYLDQFKEDIDRTWFPYIAMVLNASVATINALQVGMKAEMKKDDEECESEKQKDVETVIVYTEATEPWKIRSKIIFFTIDMKPLLWTLTRNHRMVQTSALAQTYVLVLAPVPYNYWRTACRLI